MTSAAIDFTETAYDLTLDDSQWLPTLLEAGLPMIDQGLGAAGMLYCRPPKGGAMTLLRLHLASGREDFPELHGRAMAATAPEVLRKQIRPGLATTMSENTKDSPETLALYTSHVDYCKDLLGITTVGAGGEGVAIVAPLAKVTTLSGRAKNRWQMLAAHVCAGLRLRQALSSERQATSTTLPLNAEAVLDPRISPSSMP